MLLRRKAKMRDKRFIAERRGGPLKKEQHYQLIQWACDCSEHVLHLFGEKINERLKNALHVAKEWKQGNSSVDDARKASLGAIAIANESSKLTAIAVARSVGHTVATAHMADHSLSAAWYALKAVKNAGKSIDAERKWQDKQLPLGIKELVLTARKEKRFEKINGQK
jgi:Imm-5 like putative immunity protein